jgi:ABC-type glycerol-3-phosphate transport system substrate-binding protein
MKKTLILAAIPATLALVACGETATDEAATAEAPAEITTVDDDNDTAEPVAAPAAEEEPHDESVPHDH